MEGEKAFKELGTRKKQSSIVIEIRGGLFCNVFYELGEK
jgi:hypothetical protein